MGVKIPGSARLMKNGHCMGRDTSIEEVRQILGEPDKIENDYTDDPIWTYHYDTNGIPIYFGNVKFGTIGPLWNQKKRVVIEWQEPD